MKVIKIPCPDCDKWFPKITLFGEYYMLLECCYCHGKYKITYEQVTEKKLEILEHE